MSSAWETSNTFSSVSAWLCTGPAIPPTQRSGRTSPAHCSTRRPRRNAGTARFGNWNARRGSYAAQAVDGESAPSRRNGDLPAFRCPVTRGCRLRSVVPSVATVVLLSASKARARSPGRTPQPRTAARCPTSRSADGAASGSGGARRRSRRSGAPDSVGGRCQRG